MLFALPETGRFMHREPTTGPALVQRLGALGAAACVLALAPSAQADHFSGSVQFELTRALGAATTSPPSTDDDDSAAWLPAPFVVPLGHRPVAARARLGSTGQALQAQCLGSTGFRGYQIALVRVARPQAAGTIEVEIETTSGAVPPVSRLRPDANQDAAALSAVSALVANPALVTDAAVQPAASATHRSTPTSPTLSFASDRSGGLHLTGDPSLDGDGVRYLIITPAALQAAFQPLADWKTRRGVPATIRTFEWILSRTRQGMDRAETLRNFLVEAYALWGVEYVLIGGDSDVIPSRVAWSLVYGGSTAPTDHYFACLDGNWNADGDALWGEGGRTSEPSEADILPELCIGRAPVNNVAQAQTFVQRVIDYESPVYADYQNRMTFLAEVLIPANWDSGMAVSYDGAIGTEQMIGESVPPGTTLQRLYDTYWLYPGSSPLSKAATIASMNAGVGLVNQLGHGFRYTMSCGDFSLVNADADQLSNGRRTFVLVMANCAAASFDYNCLAEHFLLNPGGGAAGVIGATRSVSASLIVTYNQAIHRQLFENGHVHLGQILDEARLERAAAADVDGSDRWIQFCLTTLGDPEMTVWTGAVTAPQLAHADSVPVARDTLDVQVSAGAQPVAGAQVCALKPGEVYAVGTTDGTGSVRLAFEPRTAGSLFLTVSGKNLATSTDTVQVMPPTGPALALAAVSVVDDGNYHSSGDGDGIVDAGETVAFLVQVSNNGPEPADSVTAQLSSSDGRFLVVQDALVVGTIEPGTQQPGLDAFLVQIDPSIVDGTAVDLPLELRDGGGGQFSTRLRVHVCAPKPEITRVQITTEEALATVSIEVKNYGSGKQPPLLVTFESWADSGVTAVRDSMQFATLQPQAASEGAPPLQFTDSTPGTTGALVLRVADTIYPRTFLHRIDRVPPPAPGAPVPDLTFSAGTVHLQWPVSTAADHLGYHVFRTAAGEGGPFVRMTADHLRNADYFDATVLPSSRYDYYIVDVDSSLQWSAPSPTLVVNTTASLLTGWPADLAEQTSSSVAVGDVDGDARPEVVVGDMGVYAWHANGQELRDGDGNPNTLGVFSLAPGLMLASVALAAIDAQPGLEIVAASWLLNRIDLWNSHGQELPGWPQQPSNGGNTGFWSSPSIADLNADGAPEIVAISKDGWLYAWHADGTPLLHGTNGSVRQVGAWTPTTATLADLDRDGHREMIVAGATAQVFVIRDDGSDFPGWPQSLFALCKASPVVGDLDKDGTLEIVVLSESNHLYVFGSDGSNRPGWPKVVPADSPDFGPSPALGDLDGDGRLEIVVCSVREPFPLTKLFVFDASGNTMLTKQLETYSQSTPILADIDGDGATDIVHGGEAGVLHAWNLAGQELVGFPIPIGDHIRSTPAYCDLDLDGYGDLVFAGWNRKVYAWRMQGPYRPDRAPWPMFNGNLGHTSFFTPGFPSPASEPPLPQQLMASWSPNPFNPSVTLRLDVPALGAVTGKAKSPSGSAASSAVDVQVVLYDARGRLVRTLVDGARLPGTYRLSWDGRDDHGRSLGSGIYLWQATAAGQHTAGKLTLLR
jgi:hypothetical protein